MLFLKGNSNSKDFSLFVIYFNIFNNKISSTPTQLLNFQEFSNHQRLLSFKEFSNSLFIRTFLLLDTQEQANLNMQNFMMMLTFSILDLFCNFCPKINLEI